MKKVLIELLLLLGISSFVVFFQFNEVPKKLSWDEVEFSRLALSLDNKTYTPYSQLATGHSTLYFYIILLSFKVFGVTNFALRFPAAVFGVFNVLLFYLIVRSVLPDIKYFGKHFFRNRIPILSVSVNSLFPLLLSLILLTSRWYFNFARFSFEATFLLFLELVSTLTFLYWFKAKKVIFLVLVGFFAGLAFLSYYPGRIFFILPLFFIIFYSQREFIVKYVLIFLLACLLTAAPLLTYLTTHSDQRVQEQLFLLDKKLDISQKTFYFTNNILKVAFMFNLEGDLNGRHNYPGKPIFNPVIGSLFIFGLIITLIKYKNFYNQFFLSFFIISLLPTFFTYPAENPNILRAYTAIIPTVYFIGNGIIYLFQSEHKSKMLFAIVVFALTVLLILSSLYDLRTYFLYQKQVFKSSFELNGTIQRIINLQLWERSQTF